MQDVDSRAIDSDSARFTRALRAAILWPVCAILFTAALMVVLNVMLLKTVKWSEHSYEVIAQTRACEARLLDAQSELRGYLLTGTGDFPQRFDAVRRDVNDSFLKLTSLVKNKSDQQIRAQAMAATKDLWFDHARSVLELHAQQGTADFLKVGDATMESLRHQLQNFTTVEETLHDERLAHVGAVKRAVAFAGSAMALILALTVGQLVRRQFAQLGAGYRTALNTIEQRHTALLRSEADLEKQKEWFRVTLTSIADGVIVTDKEGRVVFMNQESERLTGWKSVEALLKPLDTVFRVVEQRSGRLPSPAPAVGAETSHRDGSILLVSKNGESYPVDESRSPIHDAQGASLGTVLVFRNATEVRRAQDELRHHSEELERHVKERTTALEQTVSELESFSYTVSHDLRSPLRAMQGFSQALIEDYGPKLDEQARNYLERIRNAAERLDRLIQDLLSYTRLSRQELERQPLDLDKLLHELVQDYPNLHPPAADVKIQGFLPHILGQESVVTQIFSNLLGNAAKFVPAGTVPVIRVWSEDLGSRARIWIEDNGIGVPVQDQARIFQMFVQAGDSHRYGGTGVGLAIVKKAVESMHGRVGMTSGAEAGSKFWVELDKAA